MSNPSIVDRMIELCDRWDAGQIGMMTLGEELIGLATALEGVPFSVVEEARNWEGELVMAADVASYAGSEAAAAEADMVVERIRDWIDDLHPRIV